MTPRALLTTIGATAIAFAVIIGAAAGTASSVVTLPATTSMASGAYPPSLQVNERFGTELALPAATGSTSRMSVDGRDCPIAV